MLGVVPVKSRADGFGSAYVVCQDSSLENWEKVPGGDVKHGQENNIDAPGRILVRDTEWLDVWHDVGADGTKYMRFGIAVGPKSQ